MSQVDTFDPVATIAIVNPDNEDIRAVFGLFESNELKTRLDIRLLETETTMPLKEAERYVKHAFLASMDLNRDFINGNVHALNPDWKFFNDPKGRRLFKDEWYGGMTGVKVKTTIVAESEAMIGLARLLEETYSRVNGNGPESI